MTERCRNRSASAKRPASPYAKPRVARGRSQDGDLPGLAYGGSALENDCSRLALEGLYVAGTYGTSPSSRLA